MALYEGVLEGFSDGQIISSEPRYTKVDTWTGRVVAGPRPVYADHTRRAYIDVSGQRIRNVILTPYQDALLQESLGQLVALSMVGPRAQRPGSKRVIAMRTPRGVEKAGLVKLVAAVLATTVMFWGLAVVGALIVIAAIAAATFLLPDIVGRVGMGIVLLVALWLVVTPVYSGVRAFQAWTALPRATAHESEAMSITKR
jgi:hypothetical protein